MKKLAITLLFAAFAVVSFAQVTVVATLQHEDALSHFIGKDGLKAAYNAAVDGDIITLSPGTFNSTGDFKKGITLRGAGIDADFETYIQGDVNFYSMDSTLVTTVEGIKFSNNVFVQNNSSGEGQGKIKFVKNYFNSDLRFRASGTYSTVSGPKCYFYNDIINYHLNFERNSYPNAIFSNCFITYPYSDLQATTTSCFVNCIVNSIRSDGNYNNRTDYSNYLNYLNCIFYWRFGTNSYNYRLPSTATAINCLANVWNTYLNNTDLTWILANLPYGSSINNWYNNDTDLSKLFKTYRGGQWTKGETFELTDSIAALYLGTDGTQVGMQGGAFPYTSTVSYPVITTFNPATSTTKDGKLKVEAIVDEKKK